MDASAVLVATEAWARAFPGAVVGALVMRGVRNPDQSAALEDRKRGLEEELRAAGPTALGNQEEDRVLRAYVDYYRGRGKTYPVEAQRDSVAGKATSIQRRAALVEAMFMAELKNLILTAGAGGCVARRRSIRPHVRLRAGTARRGHDDGGR